MTGDHFDQYATLNPVPDVDALPEGASTETALLKAINRKAAEAAAPRGMVTSPRRRRWKGPLIAVAVMAAALIAGVTVLTMVSRPNTAGEPEPTPTTQPQRAPESSGMGDPAMWVWTEIEAPGGQILSDGRQFYAVNRGNAAESVTIWSSTDGLTWRRHLNEIAGEPFYAVKDMVAASGRLLISFQSVRMPDPPLTAADRPIVVAVVEADGSVASGEIRPEVPEALAGYASIDIVASAVGPRGALIWTVPALDRDAIARAAFGDRLGVGDRLGFGLEPVIVEGNVVLERISGDRQQPTADPVPLTDLGIDETVLREASKLWVSADGREWRSTPAPDFLDVSADILDVSGRLQDFGVAEADIVGVDDGFLIRHETRVSYSPDGSEWSELPTPLEVLEDGAGMLPWLGAGLVLNDAGFWRVTSAGFERLPLSDAPTSPGRDWAGFGVGDAGIVYVHVGPSGALEIVYSPDGQTWFASSLPEVDGLTEAFGDEWFQPGPVVVGADVVLQPGGSHVFRATPPGG